MKYITAVEFLKNNVLQSIDSENFNEFTEKEWHTFIDLLKVNKSVKEIYLNTVSIPQTIIARLSDALKINKIVEKFYITGIRLDKVTVERITEIFKTNTTISDVGFINCDIDDEKLIILIDVLSFSNTTVKTLKLNENMISAKGAEAIATMSSFNHNIAVVDLSNNCIGDEGAVALASAIQQQDPSSYYADQNSYLISLSLGNNKITEMGALALETSLTNNRVMIYLDFNESNTSSQNAQILERINASLQRNKKLRNRFVDLDTDFEIIGKITTSLNSTNIYLKKDDNTKWIIKTNPGNHGRGIRLGAICEAYACQLMKLVVSDYPETILVNDGGSFQIGYSFIEDLKDSYGREISLPVRDIEENFVMVRWLADLDCQVNRWFKIFDQHIQFYKLDLGEAFFFDPQKSDITVKHLTINSVIKLFAIDKRLASQVEVEKIAEVIKFIVKLDPSILRTTGELFVEMLGKHGAEIIESLLIRKEAFAEILPNLLTTSVNISESSHSLWSPKKLAITTDIEKQSEFKDCKESISEDGNRLGNQG